MLAPFALARRVDPVPARGVLPERDAAESALFARRSRISDVDGVGLSRLQRRRELDEEAVQLAFVFENGRAETNLVDRQVLVEIELNAVVVREHPETDGVRAAPGTCGPARPGCRGDRTAGRYWPGSGRTRRGARRRGLADAGWAAAPAMVGPSSGRPDVSNEGWKEDRRERAQSPAWTLRDTNMRFSKRRAATVRLRPGPDNDLRPPVPAGCRPSGKFGTARVCLENADFPV